MIWACNKKGIILEYSPNFDKQPTWKRPLGRPKRGWEDNIINRSQYEELDWFGSGNVIIGEFMWIQH